MPRTVPDTLAHAYTHPNYRGVRGTVARSVRQNIAHARRISRSFLAWEKLGS